MNALNKQILLAATAAKILAVVALLAPLSDLALFLLGKTTTMPASNEGFTNAVHVPSKEANLLYLTAMLAIQAYTSILLLRFANGVKPGIFKNDEHAMAKGFHGLSAYFAFTGLLFVLKIVLLLVGAFLLGTIAQG